MSPTSTRLLIAASGTGGHLFPALALAEQLQDYEIEWLGTPNRLEQTLVPHFYPLHTISVEGLQKPLSLNTLKILQGFITATIFQVRRLLKERKIDAVFTTGGYIAAPAILAARLQGLPVILHESNFIPGKVTRLFSPFTHAVALGFADTAKYLPRAKTFWVGTPVRSEFCQPQPLDLPIPPDAFLIVVIGGSQGAVALNQLVRQCVQAWFEARVWVVHLTGEQDQDRAILQHPQYFSLPFYQQMAGLLQRANLAISRAGAGSLTELAITHTPAILVPYPYGAEDHQTFNAQVFAAAGAAYVYPQAQLTAAILASTVLDLVRSPILLQKMKEKMATLAKTDSASLLAELVAQTIFNYPKKSDLLNHKKT
ncbi:MAG: undecaprenyldiphospho-muramoylpentapeptide beta-N-acetylglucosaminyltransferase [Gomphosphaeria aponina SAG 52.96 = DSM 107014]|uniref:UDP-N-acetylglucosamine--N-acetylmuramyl-(pentapeptide) pyrophosphoryl-undecaprenol N-acetylglucosamine transferase n=1 Tax=Gomphosphaeria aponina SAG 52.96 = DSM 107014 TaxID=1521640 RepID=A0A941JV26_9CHRO|nr:undecaprenyldiphospho-muramoylpentapeptide beta-N-acetylglucosaminyltransferase [Gomphosphaeria aponina SAG 52.96 = DSM 107014]